MSSSAAKPQSPKVPKPREVIVRFRVTEDDYAEIEEAAAFEGARFEAELVERGLPKSVVQTLKRPSEWMRYVVMKAATPIAAEARQKRAQEEERRAREAEEYRIRVAREAERNIERLVMGTGSTTSPFFDDTVRAAMEQAKAGYTALEHAKAGLVGHTALKEIMEGGASGSIKAIKESLAFPEIVGLAERLKKPF